MVAAGEKTAPPGGIDRAAPAVEAGSAAQLQQELAALQQELAALKRSHARKAATAKKKAGVELIM